ncbi:MAG TPA: hypothetical protein ENH40_06520 [Nitrospirae bacterium]|nr:hypothetical protein [Nitrospirota bacterium]
MNDESPEYVLLVSDKEKEGPADVQIRHIMDEATDQLCIALEPILGLPLEMMIVLTEYTEDTGRTRISSNIDSVGEVEKQLTRSLQFVRQHRSSSKNHG